MTKFRCGYQDGDHAQLFFLCWVAYFSTYICRLNYSAVMPEISGLDGLPETLSDRMVYDPEIDSYLVTCGSDSLAQIQVEEQSYQDGALHLSGALVYLVDGSRLTGFRAVLTPRDNMFGYTLTRLELV